MKRELVMRFADPRNKSNDVTRALELVIEEGTAQTTIRRASRPDRPVADVRG